MKEYKPHSARVMSIWMDSEKKTIFSVGEDKRLVVFDFKQKKIVSGT